jgi:hypothetical protein
MGRYGKVDIEAETATARQTEAGRPGAQRRTLTRLQRTHGNQYVQRLIQPRLRVGLTGDRLEEEADRLAEQVTDGDAPRSRIARAGRGAGGVVDPVVHRLLTDARDQGAPLPASIRRGFEQSLRVDLGGVRLHTGRGADDVNLRLRSSAATVGSDIFFRNGEYDPASDTGRELLAHELVHVVQQAGGADGGVVQRGKRKGQRKKKSEDDDFIASESESEGDADYTPGSTASGDYDDDDDYDKDDSREARSKAKTKTKAKQKPKAKKSTAKKRKHDESEATEDVKEPPQKKALVTEDIDVGYLSLDKMKEYLTGEKLPTDKEPAPILAGVVVWNINHLKADDDDEEGEEKKPVTRKRAKEAKKAADYDTDAILKGMDDLRAALKPVAAGVTAAVEQAIADLGEPPKGAEKAYAGTKRELSQLKTDIAVLQKGEFGDVLKTATAAMAAHQADRGKASIEARAERLVQVRALSRVVKRFNRLNTVLLTGNARIPAKKAARETVRAALDKKARKNVGDAIANLQRLLPSEDLEATSGSIKRGAVVDLTTDTFFTNPAISLVLINEMNLGIKALTRAIEKTKGSRGLSSGPIMLAKGQKLPEDSKRKSPVKIGTQQFVGRQYEFYPAVHRSEGPRALTPAGTFYVSSAGQFAVQGEDGENSAIPWNKTDKTAKTFRGIVVHRYRQAGQEFWAGILHTTPAGKDLQRVNIWPQIKAPLENLNELARHFKIPLIVGGDFYIPAEGIVNSMSDDQLSEVEGADPGWTTTAKLEILARNVFLAAQAEMTPKQLAAFTALVSTAEPVKQKVVRRPRGAPKKPKAPAFRAATPVWRTHAGISKPDQQRQWNAYRAAAKTAIGKLPKGLKAYRREVALSVLAPGKKYAVDWNVTLGAGGIQQVTVHRNYRRPFGPRLPGAHYAAEEPKFTMRRALEDFGYRIIEAPDPTNPKEKGRGENTRQIADLFLVNEYWKTTGSGVVTPGKGELKPADDAGFTATETYWKISDHSPAGMLGSTTEYDPQLYGAYNMAPKAAMKAVWANLIMWWKVENLFGTVRALPGVPTILEQVAAIKQLVGEPLLGPDKQLLDQLGVLTRRLKTTIMSVPGFRPDEKQAAILDDLDRWQPYYVIDIAEEPPEGKQEAPEGKPAATTTKTEPVTTTQPAATMQPAATTALATGPVTTVPVQGPVPLDVPHDPDAMQADAPPPVNWPTGQIAHYTNSCYLAALIQVLASNQAFRDLLDPAQRPQATQQVKDFQTNSELHRLATKLRDPQATISRDEMGAFMGYLDGLNGMLTPEPLTDAERKKAALLAKQATTKKKSAVGLQQDAAEILLRVLNRLGPPLSIQSQILSTLHPPTAEGAGNLEPHPVLSLNIDNPAIKSVSGALQAFSTPIKVEAGYPVVSRTKTMQFSALPDVLTIALSRFVQTDKAGGQRKLKQPVVADNPLTIPDSCLTPELANTLGDRPARYQLIHMVSHEGETTSGGHYVSYGKFPGSDEWFKHDDTAPPERRTLPDAITRLDALQLGYIYVYVRIQ